MISKDTESVQLKPISPSPVSNGKDLSSLSVDTSASIHSARSHKEYLDTLVPPSRDEIERITSVQEEKEEQLFKRQLSKEDNALNEEELSKAAGLIQRNYRGYRERRQLKGLALDPTSRWVEAFKEARYRHLTTPKARDSLTDGERPSTGSEEEAAGVDSGDSRRHSSATRNWKKVGLIATRAAGDEDTDSTDDEENIPEEQLEVIRDRRAQEKAERQKGAKMMDLQ